MHTMEHLTGGSVPSRDPQVRADLLARARKAILASYVLVAVGLGVLYAFTRAKVSDLFGAMIVFYLAQAVLVTALCMLSYGVYLAARNFARKAPEWRWTDAVVVLAGFIGWSYLLWHFLWRYRQ
jgi:uncharacterized SAM-binding protein YcdF (DUF218 family)